MTISVTHQPGHKFYIALDGVPVELSYKSCGGRKCIEALGDEGIRALLETALLELKSGQGGTAIRDLFTTFGASNTIKIIEQALPDDFEAYFLRMAHALALKGDRASFRGTLQFITGTKATLNQDGDNEYIQRLKAGCDSIANGVFRMDMAVRTFDALAVKPEYLDVEADGIKVSFRRKGNNIIYYSVNGVEIGACCNRVHNEVNTQLIMDVALEIRHAVQLQASLIPITKEWGGSFVFRLMRALCEEGSYRYFQSMAGRLTASRQKIEPHKLLEGHHYAFNDSSNADFIDRILSILEAAKTNEAPSLTDDNRLMLLSDEDVWQLYYSEGIAAKLRQLDFATINRPELRQQAKHFLRERFYSEEEIEVTQLARYFYCLRTGLNSLMPHTESIQQIRIADARLIKSSMEHEGKSVNEISETIMVMRLMFDWFCTDEELENPFEHAQIPGKGNFLEVTPSASDEAIELINEYFGELPDCVQLAFLLLFTTYSRGNDIFTLSVNDIKTDLHGKTVIEAYSGKNGEFGRDEISPYLAGRIFDYVVETQGIREEMGTDILLVYRDERDRRDSLRGGQILNAAKFSYHVNKLLEKNAPSGKACRVTARSLRAYGGRQMQAAGMSESEKSRKLKNTISISRKHYSDVTAFEEARNYERLLNTTFLHLLEPIRAESPTADVVPTPVLFGKCNSQNGCRHKLSCTSCAFRMIKKEGTT